MMRHILAVSALLVPLVAPFTVAAADDPCALDCEGDLTCERRVSDCLLRSDRAREAIGRFKLLLKEDPESAVLAQLLAKAYLTEGNMPWAQRTLQGFSLRDDSSCEVRSWLAWVYVKRGELELASEVLGQPGCPSTEAEQARWLLLTAYISQLKQQPVDEDQLAQVRQRAQLFPEDEALWLSLRRRHDPGWLDPVSTRLELAGGFTSNASAGSPTDKQSVQAASQLAQLDAYTRFLLPISRTWRPFVEANVKGHGLSAPEAQDLSYLNLSARPGVVLAAGGRRLTLSYNTNLLLLAEEKKRWFHEGHRGEAELETENGMVYFAGGGRRFFHENGRTRWELDGGSGGSLSLGSWGRVLLLGSARYLEAIGDAYDLCGGTALAVSRVSLPARTYLRASAALNLDHYFNSGGGRGELAFGTQEKRTDFRVKVTASIWSPPLFGGPRVSVGYELSYQDSTADSAHDNYDYLEHRPLVRLRWSGDFDPWSPAVSAPDDHVAIEYGMGGGVGNQGDEERIQDLLRQDESARSTSCGCAE